MKKVYFLLVLSLIAGLTHGQNLIGKSFVTRVNNIRVYPVDTLNDGRHFYYVKINTKFTVTAIDSKNNLIITFWPYKNYKREENLNQGDNPLPNVLGKDFQDYSMLSNPQNNISERGGFGQVNLEETNTKDYDAYVDQQYIGAWAESESFVIPLASFNERTQPYFGKSNSFNWGVMTLPVKLRTGNKNGRYFNFEEKINLGFTAGLKHQFQGRIEQSINYLVGFGIASVKTDSVSMNKGFYNSEHLSATAFSFNLGVLYQYEIFQIGIFAGKDYIASTLSREWKYQGKTWIGLAIGISLFGREAAKEAKGEN